MHTSASAECVCCMFSIVSVLYRYLKRSLRSCMEGERVTENFNMYSLRMNPEMLDRSCFQCNVNGNLEVFCSRRFNRELGVNLGEQNSADAKNMGSKRRSGTVC